MRKYREMEIVSSCGYEIAYVCETCGTLVVDRERHNDDHKANVTALIVFLVSIVLLIIKVAQ